MRVNNLDENRRAGKVYRVSKLKSSTFSTIAPDNYVLCFVPRLILAEYFLTLVTFRYYSNL